MRVVSALHTVSAADAARDLDHELDEDVLICGDRKADKRAAAEIIERDPRAALRGLPGAWRWRASSSR